MCFVRLIVSILVVNTTCYVLPRKQSALGVAKGFAHVEGKSIFGGKLGYLNSGFVKQMGLDHKV
jgi:hypothetical protein